MTPAQQQFVLRTADTQVQQHEIVPVVRPTVVFDFAPLVPQRDFVLSDWDYIQIASLVTVLGQKVVTTPLEKPCEVSHSELIIFGEGSRTATTSRKGKIVFISVFSLDQIGTQLGRHVIHVVVGPKAAANTRSHHAFAIVGKRTELNCALFWNEALSGRVPIELMGVLSSTIENARNMRTTVVPSGLYHGFAVTKAPRGYESKFHGRGIVRVNVRL